MANEQDQLIHDGEQILRQMEQTTPTPTPTPPAPAKAIRVCCGANSIELENMEGYSIEQVRHKMREVLNVTNDHRIVLVNGREIDVNVPYALNGTEEIEFKKPAGAKG